MQASSVGHLRWLGKAIQLSILSAAAIVRGLRSLGVACVDQGKSEAPFGGVTSCVTSQVPLTHVVSQGSEELVPGSHNNSSPASGHRSRQ